MQRRAMPGLVALALLVSGCAGGRTAEGSPGAYTDEVGPAIIPAVEREAMPILQRFGYTIQRTERTADRIMIETSWVNRAPFADEAAAGAVDVRTRVLISTRPRSTTNSAGSTVSGVTLRLEVEHMGQSRQSWSAPAERSAELAALFRRLSDAFRLEFQVKGLEG
jgi:hypothetical protein